MLAKLTRYDMLLYFQISLPIVLSADYWVLILEQGLLLILIVGRWMLPKGDVTYDQLSQLLFVYIGIASDIMEIFVLFEEQAVLRHRVLPYCVLTIWSTSLLQYTLVLTATRARKPRVAHPTQKTEMDDTLVVECGVCYCCETEIWAILITILLQDLPFLIIRMYVIIVERVINYTILFFTCKNILVVCLQFFRLTVIASMPAKEKQRRDMEEREIMERKLKSNSIIINMGNVSGKVAPFKKIRVLRRRHTISHGIVNRAFISDF